MLLLWNPSPPCCGEQCAKTNTKTWNYDAIKLLICKFSQKNVYQHVKQLQALSWTKGGAILFSFFLFLSFFFLLPLSLCKMSLTPCFQKMCHGEAKEAFLSVSESSNDESSLHHITPGDKASLRDTRRNYNSSNYCSGVPPTGDVLRLCAPLENKTFSYLQFHSDKCCSPFICILYMFTLYLALPKRETILNVLSSLF